MLHRIQISTNTCVVTMQVKRAIGKATLHKLPIYNEYMRLCWVSTLFWMICCLFSNCSKSSTIRLRSLYITFPCVVKVPRSHVPVLLAMQWSVAWRSAFYRGREHLWIVFSFKWEYSTKHKSHTGLKWLLNEMLLYYIIQEKNIVWPVIFYEVLYVWNFNDDNLKIISLIIWCLFLVSTYCFSTSALKCSGYCFHFDDLEMVLADNHLGSLANNIIFQFLS